MFQTDLNDRFSVNYAANLGRTRFFAIKAFGFSSFSRFRNKRISLYYKKSHIENKFWD